MSIFSGTIYLKHDVFGIKIICYDAHCGNLMIIPSKLTVQAKLRTNLVEVNNWLAITHINIEWEKNFLPVSCLFYNIRHKWYESNEAAMFILVYKWIIHRSFLLISYF